MDANGNPIDGEIIWAGVGNRAVQLGNANTTLNFDDLDNVGYFVLDGGYTLNQNTINNGDAVTFQQVGDSWQAVVNGTVLSTNGVNNSAYFSDASLNHNDEVRMVPDPLHTVVEQQWLTGQTFTNANQDYDNLHIGFIGNPKTISFSGDDVTASLGADSTINNVVTSDITIDSQQVDSGLTLGGQTISFEARDTDDIAGDDQIVGYTNSGGDAIIIDNILDSDKISFTQLQPISNSSSVGTDATLSLSANIIDADGDTVSLSNLNFMIDIANYVDNG